MAKQVKVRVNRFGDVIEKGEKYLSLDDWQNVWEQGKTAFHQNCVHTMLVKYFPRIVDGREAPLSIFLPLSGKSVDLKWLADQGHKVIGNDISHLACQDFFKENDLEFAVRDIEGGDGKVFKSKNAQCDVTLYACDFYCLSSQILGHVDGIWDRGSYAAINPPDRQRYSQVIKSLLSQDTKYLLEVMTIDHTEFAGPPFHADLDELKKLYGDCSIDKLEERDDINERRRQWGLTEFITTDYLICKL